MQDFVHQQFGPLGKQEGAPGDDPIQARAPPPPPPGAEVCTQTPGEDLKGGFRV